MVPYARRLLASLYAETDGPVCAETEAHKYLVEFDNLGCPQPTERHARSRHQGAGSPAGPLRGAMSLPTTCTLCLYQECHARSRHRSAGPTAGPLRGAMSLPTP